MSACKGPPMVNSTNCESHSNKNRDKTQNLKFLSQLEFSGDDVIKAKVVSSFSGQWDNCSRLQSCKFSPEM